MRCNMRVLAGVSLLGLGASPVCGAETAAELAMLEADSLIVVTAPDDGYRADRTGTATKTDTPLIDVPQSISVITRDVIDDAALLSIADAVRYVPGVVAGQGEGNRDQLTIRGQNTTADFFVNGVRDDVQYYRDFYNIERLEVLKGPNAMIFGRGGGGGVINRVTKTPQAEDRWGAAASIDTYGGWRVEADGNKAVSDAAAVRLNGVYENGESFRDFVNLERYGINPTLALALGERTFVGLSYEYFKDDRVTDRGVPSQSGRPLEGYDSVFFGVPGDNRAEIDAHVLMFDLEHRFSDRATLRNRTIYGDYDKYYSNVFPSGSVAAGGNTVALSAYRDDTQRENVFSQTDLILKSRTGTLDHTLLLGFELGWQDTGSARLNGFFDPVANTQTATVTLADRIVVPDVFFRAGPGQRDSATDAQILGLYAQDQISIGDHVEIVGGLRFDRFEIDADNLLTGGEFARTDELWSPRLGVIYKPVEAASLYVSYSRSYLPQSGDQFTSLDLTSEALAPEKFENYEIGAKWDVLPDLQLTAALYQLDRTNTRAPGPTPGTTVLTGKTRSKGLELGLAGKLTDAWSLTAGYALQDAEVKQTTSAAPAGRDVAQVPKHQASLWTRYDFSPRIGAGVGLYHQSKMFASISNAVVVPSYTRVDAALFVQLTDSIDAQVNIENLFDEDYFAAAHNDNNISPGAPLAARFGLRKRF